MNRSTTCLAAFALLTGVAYAQAGLRAEPPREVFCFDMVVEANDTAARAAYEAGKFDEALTLFLEITKADARNISAWNMAGNCYFNLNRFEEAVNAYQSALSIDRKQPVIHENLGAAFYHLERHADAKRHLMTCVSLDGTRDGAWGLLGMISVLEGQPMAGVAFFDKAIALKPQVIAYHVRKVRALLEGKLYRDAEQAAVVALGVQKDSGEVHNLHGIALWQQDQIVAAEAAFRKAVEFGPKVAVYYANLAGACWQNGKKDEARSLATKAREMGLKDHWVYEKITQSSD